MRVRINGLTLVTTDGWNTNSDWDSVMHGDGRRRPAIAADSPALRSRSGATNQFNARAFSFRNQVQARTDVRLRIVCPGNRAIGCSHLQIAVQGARAHSWPGSLSNYQLQALVHCRFQLDDCDHAPALMNGQNTVTTLPTATQQFYRLQQVQ